MKLRRSSAIIFRREEEDEEERDEFNGGTYIKKGPWSAEEDEVLMKHVKKNGPRDWSSIRSKRLLPRTGKSCRLRWVNKLRPNLKTGCKFSAEEERVVIELQAEFGNKWAKIATYLEGRTDNDVKNFWSSRRKRLERMLQKSSPPSSSKKNKNKRASNHVHQPPPQVVEEVPASNPLDNNDMVQNVEMKAEEDTSLNNKVSLFESSSADLTFAQGIVPDESHHQVDYSDLLPMPMCHGLLEPGPFDDAVFLEVFEEEKKSGFAGISQNSIPGNAFFEDFPSDIFDEYFEDIPNSLDK